MMKICSNSKCIETNPQPIEHFNKKGFGLQDRCRTCNKERSREYYAANREKHLVVIKERKQRILKETREKYLRYLLDHPCVDCGETDVRVLEADHIRDKQYTISIMINDGYSWPKILAELKKCEIVCANHHRIRTYERCGSYRNQTALA